MAAPETDKENHHAAQQPHLQAYPREKREHLCTEKVAHIFKAAVTTAAQTWEQPNVHQQVSRSTQGGLTIEGMTSNCQGRETAWATAAETSTAAAAGAGHRGPHDSLYVQCPGQCPHRHQPSPRPSLSALLLSAQLGPEASVMTKWLQPWGGPLTLGPSLDLEG